MLGTVNIKKEIQDISNQTGSALNVIHPPTVEPPNNLSQNVDYNIVEPNSGAQNVQYMFVPQNNNGVQNVQYILLPQNNGVQNMQHMMGPQSIERRLVVQADGTRNYQYVFIPQKSVAPNVQYQFVFAPVNNQPAYHSDLVKDKVNDSVNNTSVPLLTLPPLPKVNSNINCNTITGDALTSVVLKKDMLKCKRNSILKPKNRPIAIRENKSQPVPVALIQATSQHIVIHKNEDLANEKYIVTKTDTSEPVNTDKKNLWTWKEENSLHNLKDLKAEPPSVKTENSDYYDIIKNTVTEKMLELNCVVEEAAADEIPITDSLPLNYNEGTKVYQWNYTGNSSYQGKQFIKYSVSSNEKKESFNNHFSNVWGYLNENDSMHQYTSIYRVKRKKEKQCGTPKKPRGRPKKVLTEEETLALLQKVKRQPGRPKRALTEEEEEELKNKVKRPKGRPKKVKTEEEEMTETTNNEEKIKKPKGRPKSDSPKTILSKFTLEQKNAMEELYRKSRRPSVESLKKLADDMNVRFRSVACWFGRRRIRKKLRGSAVTYLNKTENVENMEHECSEPMEQESTPESRVIDEQKMEHNHSQTTEQEKTTESSDSNKINQSEETRTDSQDVPVEAVTKEIEVDLPNKTQDKEEPKHECLVSIEETEDSHIQSPERSQLKSVTRAETHQTIEHFEVSSHSVTKNISVDPVDGGKNKDNLQGEDTTQSEEEVKDSESSHNIQDDETAAEPVIKSTCNDVESEDTTVNSPDKIQYKEQLQHETLPCMENEDDVLQSSDISEVNASVNAVVHPSEEEFAAVSQSASDTEDNSNSEYVYTLEQESVLESSYVDNGFPSPDTIVLFAQDLNISDQSVTTWFEQRRNKKYSRVFRLNDEQKKKLEDFFSETMYPDKSMYGKLSEEMQVSKKAISDWFHHRRAKQQKNIESTFVSSSDGVRVTSENTEYFNERMLEDVEECDDSVSSDSAIKPCCDNDSDSKEIIIDRRMLEHDEETNMEL